MKGLEEEEEEEAPTAIFHPQISAQTCISVQFLPFRQTGERKLRSDITTEAQTFKAPAPAGDLEQKNSRSAGAQRPPSPARTKAAMMLPRLGHL